MTTKKDDIIDKIGQHWNNRAQADRPVRWMGHPFIAQTFNERIYNYSSDVWGEGLIHNLTTNYMKKRKSYKRAISVACGNGRKEMRLIKQGIVEHFTFFELAKDRIEEGKQLAKNYGIEDQVDFRYGNAFEAEGFSNSFDLVIWLNAIHHMMDTPQAVAWSRDVLKIGGCFLMDDYVGPNRFQWSRIVMDTANEARSRFPASIFKPLEGRRRLPVYMDIADPRAVEDVDPSETADSARILTALSTTFSQRREFLVSSGVSTLVLNDISSRILDDKYQNLIQYTIDRDLDLVSKGHIGFAGVIAFKTE